MEIDTAEYNEIMDMALTGLRESISDSLEYREDVRDSFFGQANAVNLAQRERISGKFNNHKLETKQDAKKTIEALNRGVSLAKTEIKSINAHRELVNQRIPTFDQDADKAEFWNDLNIFLEDIPKIFETANSYVSDERQKHLQGMESNIIDMKRSLYRNLNVQYPVLAASSSLISAVEDCRSEILNDILDDQYDPDHGQNNPPTVSELHPSEWKGVDEEHISGGEHLHSILEEGQVADDPKSEAEYSLHFLDYSHSNEQAADKLNMFMRGESHGVRTPIKKDFSEIVLTPDALEPLYAHEFKKVEPGSKACEKRRLAEELNTADSFDIEAIEQINCYTNLLNLREGILTFFDDYGSAQSLVIQSYDRNAYDCPPEENIHLMTDYEF